MKYACKKRKDDEARAKRHRDELYVMDDEAKTVTVFGPASVRRSTAQPSGAAQTCVGVLGVKYTRWGVQIHQNTQ